ncbi:MAG: MarR family winged helix-turn-helix transcriptional regulator [Thermomicrobiales bacterium]
MNDPRWLTPTEEASWRGFVALHAHLIGRLEREFRRDSNLSSADYEILVALSEPLEDRLRIGELGEIVQWEKGRLSKQLSRMEARGLVAREACETDQRGSFAVLTPLGRGTIEEAAPLHVAHVRELYIDRLTTAQLEAMVEIAAAVTSGLDPNDVCAEDR